MALISTVIDNSLSEGKPLVIEGIDGARIRFPADYPPCTDEVSPSCAAGEAATVTHMIIEHWLDVAQDGIRHMPGAQQVQYPANESDGLGEPKVTVCKTNSGFAPNQFDERVENPVKAVARLVLHDRAGDETSLAVTVDGTEHAQLEAEGVGVEGVIEDNDDLGLLKDLDVTIVHEPDNALYSSLRMEMVAM